MYIIYANNTFPLACVFGLATILSAISQSARVIVDTILRHSSPSWQVQPALCTYQNRIKTSGCTCQDGVNWRQQVKIFADKNIKGSDKSETSGTNSYSVVIAMVSITRTK